MTFAERATEIMKKYNRFRGDPISEKSMNMELAELAKEQELVKQKNFMQSSGQKMFTGGNRSSLGNPDDYNPIMGSEGRGGLFNLNEILNDSYPNDRKTMMSMPSIVNTKIERNIMPEGIKEGKGISLDNEKNLGEPEKVGYMGMAGVAGNALDLTNALIKGPRQVGYDRINPQLIDSSNQERQTEDIYNTAFNNMAYTGNQVAQSSGQRMGNTSAIEANRAKQLSQALNTIRERTDNRNAEIRNNAEAVNTQIGMQEKNVNLGFKSAHEERVSSNINSIGQAFAMQSAEQNRANTVYNQNKRIIEAINSGVLSDYEITDLLLKMRAKDS